MKVNPANQGEFNFVLPVSNQFVERSIAEDDQDNPYNLPPGEWMFIEGWASDTSRDKLNGRMSERCIVGMVDCVNNGSRTPLLNNIDEAKRGAPVGLDVDHSHKWTDQIGYAVEAKAIYDIPDEMKSQFPGVTPPVMWVKNAVDLEMSHGRDLKRALQKGVKLGQSIFGRIEEGDRKVAKSGEVLEENFDLVNLTKIAMTSAPVNNVTWVKEIARSMNGVEMETQEETREATLDETVAEPVERAEAEEEIKDIEEIVAELEAETAEEGNLDAVERAEETVAEEDVVEAPAEAEAEVEESEEAPIEPPVISTSEATEESENIAEEEVAESLPESVADSATEVTRAESVEYVGSEVFRSFEERVLGLLNDVPNVVSRAEKLLAESEERLQKKIDAQELVIKSLTEKITAYGKLSPGRFGSVARGFADSLTADNKPLRDKLSKEDRIAVQRGLAEGGNPAGAIALMMGWATTPDDLVSGETPYDDMVVEHQ